MPYTPNSMDQKQRENAYWQLWLTAIASVAIVVAQFIPMWEVIPNVSAILVGVWFVTFAVYNQFDDYFMSLVKTGAVWALAALGLWLVLQGLLTVYDTGRGVGVMAAGGEFSEGKRNLAIPSPFSGAFFLAGICSTAFHAGFLFNHHRWRA